ncbi:hypothetical protein SELMODRAFT_406731 [Selaginella moellendorffii]|uniref:DUF659 domain-containing protein n=1 Tax=Selaginella moellendorffii TaxID=88036 RepID=D8R1A0_SELML|nr:hypothetical protein SELMODRAFT_406731 [Selaginella moellendorffii]
MRRIERKCGLSSIVTDNAANMWLVGCKFKTEFEDMWSVPCLDNIKQYLDIGKCIVQFVKNSTRVHAFYQVQHPKWQFVRPVITRQLATTTKTTNQAMTAVEDFNFWAGVEKVMQLIEVVVMAIKFFDRSVSNIGFVWQAWHFFKFKIATVTDAHKLNQEYFAYVNGTSPFSIANSCDAQELLEKGKDGDSPWHVWASAVSFSYESREVLWSNILTLKQNKKESKTSCNSATWTRGEFDIPKENDSLVVGGNGTGHTTIGFKSYAEVDIDDSMLEDEDDDFNRDSGLRLAHGKLLKEIVGSAAVGDRLFR